MIRKISIEAVLNGFIVEVGCQRVVFTDRLVMVDKINLYLIKPDEEEERWLTDSLNAKHFKTLPESSRAPCEAPAQRDDYRTSAAPSRY